MYRSLLTITAVAAISYCLANFEQAQGQRLISTDWVRTADGWQSSAVLRTEARTQTLPALHPVLVASFQLGVSLFALLAFPSQVQRGKQASAGRVKRVRIRGMRRWAAFHAR